MHKYSFRFRKIWVDAINSLNEESRLCLYTAICKYALDGQTPDFSDLPTENAIFSLIKEQIDDDNNMFINEDISQAKSCKTQK